MTLQEIIHVVERQVRANLPEDVLCDVNVGVNHGLFSFTALAHDVRMVIQTMQVRAERSGDKWKLVAHSTFSGFIEGSDSEQAAERKLRVAQAFLQAAKLIHSFNSVWDGML